MQNQLQIKMTDKLNDKFDLNNTGVSNFDQTRNLPRHRWYFYKEGFSPALVKKAIEETGLRNNDLILDPFNGSGTVTLTAAVEGINSIGFEVNPFTSFLSKTKTHNLSKKTFLKESENVLLNCLKGEKSNLEAYSTFSQDGKNEKYLFNKEVIQSFSGGQKGLDGSNSKSSNLLRLAMISAAMNNSNAKKDGKCLRYKNDWEKLAYSKDTFINSLEKELEIISDDLDVNTVNKPLIKNGDSRVLIDKMSEKFKLCITSPPYLNTFDYTDIYRPELFLGNFINSSDELRLLRHQTVRSHIQVNWKNPISSDFGPIYNDVLKEINSKKEFLMHARIPEMITAYFEDMKSVFKSLRSKADEKASLWMVVSTSAYADVHIPVDLILAHIATQTGWKLKEIGVLREITKRKTKYSPNIDKLRESVIILTT